MAAQQRHRGLEEGFGRGVGLGDLAVRRDHQHRMRQRVEHRVGGRRWRTTRMGSARFMPPPSSRRRRRRRRDGAARRAGSFGGQHVRAMRLQLSRRDAARSRPPHRAPSRDACAHGARRCARRDARASRRRASTTMSQLRRRAAAPARCRRSRDNARDLPGQPRPALRARGRPSPHRRRMRRAPRRRRRTSSMSPLTTTGIDDRVLHGAHRGPVGRALVELAARAAVHGDQLHAGGFGAARKLRRVERARRPSRAASSASPAPRPRRPSPRSASAHDRDRASAPSRTSRRSPAWPGSPC